ncbi:MAG TPA: hypothetical protein VIH57_14405, partial [Bacteroidales bacterium]
DKSQFAALLNAYSIQEITAIFGEIDEKIASLHSCSSEDFLTLNAYFKKYYADSKTISNNATELFSLITNKDSQKKFLENLKNFHDTLHVLLADYEKVINEVISSIQLMIREMDQMFVTANNLKQDLMTLKLLVANLKLDVIISPTPIGKIARKTNDFNELIVLTKSFFIEFYKHSTQFKEAVKTFNEQLTQQRDRNIQHINEITTEITHSTNLYDQKNREAIQLVPKLSENTQNTSNSIAKIITNLQYQDIIRQKIDHIQQTHKDILKELNEIEESDNEELNVKNRVKCFMQIRDVAGLQAAQLIHANKEYQKAIEVISGNFLEVGNDMNNIAALCHQLTGNSNSINVSHLDEIREKIEKTEYFSDSFQKSIVFLKEKTSLHNAELNELVNNYDELSDFIGTIDKSMSKALDNQTSVEVEQFEKTTLQIRNILSELHSINDLYHSQFQKIKEICPCNIQSESINIESVESKLQLFNTQCEQLIGNLFETNESIFKILSDNQLLSKSLSLDIKTSLEQIKYYDYFDKVIEEIIQKLNEINMKLQNVDGASDEIRQKHLEFLKSRYTMQSEHVIHDHITKNDIDLLSLNSTGADEDDDNLELF